MARIKSGCCKFRDLVPFLAGKSLPSEQNAGYIPHVYVVLRYVEVTLGQLKRMM